MPSDLLTPEARRENAVALASASGLDLDSATEALSIAVLITVDHADLSALQVAEELSVLLSRTVQSVSFDTAVDGAAAEVVVGAALERTAAPKVFICLSEDAAIISRTRRAAVRPVAILPVLGLLVACYAAAATLRLVLGEVLPCAVPDPFIVRFDELGLDTSHVTQVIDVGQAYLAGAGAIGNGLLWAARHLDVRGQLNIADDDVVGAGNLNRQMWFRVDDIGHPKPTQLVMRAQAQFPRLKLVARPHRIQDLPEKSDGPWLKRLIVAVDSRRARRQLQNEFPGEVFDASTTDIREVVTHYHKQPTDNACLSCIYAPDEEEYSREHHIAEHLGLTVDEVRRERISTRAARVIAARFPQVSADALTGASYDTLFKRLCAESLLNASDGRRIVAPFAFVSVLAGTFLALEMVRRLVPGAGVTAFNYWRMSAWHPPYGRRRRMRAREAGCSFCGNPLLAEVNRTLWTRRNS